MRKIFRAGAIAAITATALATSGCGGSAPNEGGQVEQSGQSSETIKLTYGTWAPSMKEVVEVWNDSHPNIQVKVLEQDAGEGAVTKLLTQIKAGSGAPDLVQAEYQKIPTLVSAGALLDISEWTTDVADAFPDGVWESVTLGGDAVYAIPQDTGPMMFYYRADIFEEYGLSVPTTWAEYAETARTLHEKAPKKFLGTFSSNDPGWFKGLAQQAGASWWGIEGEAWSVDINSEATTKVAEYWGGLVEEGVISNQPMYTPEWNAALNDGTQVGWVGAVWGPGVLAGNAGDTKGKWKAAPLPQWKGDGPSNGNWGGSSTGVTPQSDHPEAAAKFATWINTDPKAVKALVNVSNIYPAATETAQQYLNDPPEFFSNQPDFYDVAAKAAENVNPFGFGPNVNVAYSVYSDQFATAAQSKNQSAFGDAVEEMQDKTVANLKESGFNVSE